VHERLEQQTPEGAPGAPESSMRTTQSPPQDLRGDKPLVLIIDDNRDNREMYARFLRLKGLRVAEADEGHAGVTMARELLPDVILMDLTMPGLDGWEATRQIKDDPSMQHIPIIVISGHWLVDGSGGAHLTAADDFVGKPCLPEDLLAKIEQHLRTSNQSG
jgi:two-component system, cell cycle response regulator DivK